jgi:hypothetical protein
LELKSKAGVIIISICIVFSFLLGNLIPRLFLTPQIIDTLEPYIENQCVPDVYNQFINLKRYGEALGFNLRYNSPDPTVYHHYQGIQRLPGQDKPIFFVTQSSEDKPGYLHVISMGSKPSTDERLRSNKFKTGKDTEDTAPSSEDKIVHTVFFDDQGWPDYNHPGGIQLLDNILAVPLEQKVQDNLFDPDLYDSRIILIDVTDPMNPIKIYEKKVFENSERRTGAIAITRQSNGKLLMLALGGDNNEVFVYESNLSNVNDPNFDFSRKFVWDEGNLEVGNFYSDDGKTEFDYPTGRDGYQSINFVQQCDGQLFLVGTRNTNLPGMGGEDWAELYHVEWNGHELNLFLRASLHFYCNSDNAGRVGNFRASAGVYVSPSGELILYTTEHDNDGKEDSVRMGEFRHKEVNRPGSPLLLPKADAGGPYVVEEGGSIQLSGSAISPFIKPWVELFEHDTFRGRSIVYDWWDRYKDDFNDFDELDDFGDKASSVRWFAPVGCNIMLYEHDNYNNYNDGRTFTLEGTGKVESITNLDRSAYNDIGDDVSSIRFTGTSINSYLDFKWDLDLDGVSETYESEPIFITHTNEGWIDGPNSVMVRLEVNFYEVATIAYANVEVINVPPTARIDIDHTDIFDADGDGDDDWKVYFKGIVYDPGVRDSHTIRWDFDGTIVENTLTPSHIFYMSEMPQNYWITLVVEDDDGGVGADSQNFSVSNRLTPGR